MGVSGVQNGHPTVNSQHRCQCVDDLLAPIRSKMKVLKKIKKRIGIGSKFRSMKDEYGIAVKKIFWSVAVNACWHLSGK